jgi:hypothetical protein
VGFRARVDRSANFGHPQLNTEVRKHGKGQPKLVSVEGSLSFTDHQAFEATLKIGKACK